MSLDTFTEMYMDYRNNFLSVDAFAAHYGISIRSANRIVELGRAIVALEI